MVVPRMCSGWLEVQTMGALRADFVERLRAADKEGRLRVYYPRVSEDVDVFVHSKVMVVDDAIARVGSANLSNRSMRVDSECDISIDARGDARVQAAIARFRDQLLAEHLGTTPSALAEAVSAANGSLIQGVESLRQGPRTLEPVGNCPEDPPPPDAILRLAADPERPIDPEQLVDTFLLEDEVSARARLRKRAAIAAIVALALGLAWAFSPLRERVTPAEIEIFLRAFRASPFAPVVIAVIFAAATLLMVPVNALILGVSLSFSAATGVLYSILGVLTAASAGYGVGRVLGRDALGRLSGPRINRLSKRLARSGVLTVAAARLVPVAPFGVVNLVAGASHIRYRQFLLGTLLGNLPGVVLLSVFGQGVVRAIIGDRRSPGFAIALAVLAALTVGCAVAWWVRRVRLLARERERASQPGGPELRTSSAGADG
jgi:uncharacterized membrane protein YdjX (TVP38/TMEM64 family)